MIVGSGPQVAPAIFEQIEDHIHSDTAREVGGILVGRVEEDGVHIDAGLPALRAVGASANVTFTHEVWEEVLPTVDRDYPDSQIIGWYHSHPGFGVFLSEYDLFIHRNFFAGESMLALVVDPLTGEGGWFGWRAGDIEQVASFEGRVSKAEGKVAVDRVVEARNRRGAAILVAALLAVVGFGGGYALGSRDNTASSTSSNRATPSALADAQNEIAQLQRELAVATAPTTTIPSSTAPSSTGPLDVLVDYQVERGDCLWCLAVRFYGDGNLYVRILEANPGLARDLAIGTTVKIPMLLERSGGGLQLPGGPHG